MSFKLLNFAISITARQKILFMKSFLKILFCLLIWNCTEMFGQVDEHQYEESAGDSPEDFPILHVKYFGLGINHVMLRDELATAMTYSGIGGYFSLIDCELWSETGHYNFLLLGWRTTKIKPRFSENVSTNPILNHTLSHGEFNFLKLNAEARIKNSPHYLGGVFGMNILFLESPVTREEEIGSLYQVYDTMLPLGISYIYDKKILGLPININFSIPIVYYRITERENNFGSLNNYFSPTAKVTLYASRQKDVPRRWEISYVWNYTNMNRASALSYNHRRLTNGLNLTLGFGGY